MNKNKIALHIGNIQGITALMNITTNLYPDRLAIETGLSNINKLCEQIMIELKERSKQ